MRGRLKSGGTFEDTRPHNPNKKSPKDIDESSDTFDTIDWLVKHVPGNNGKAGILGVSYPGFYAAHALIDAHPALKAASPQAPVTDMYDGDDFRHNGALLLAHNFDFMTWFPHQTPRAVVGRRPREFEYGTADAYKFFLGMGPLANADKVYLKGSAPYWSDMAKHPDYDDYCKDRDLRPHLKAIKPAVLTVGGWFDAEDLAGTLYVHKRIAETSPDCPQNVLVMGPWTHGGWTRGPGDAVGPVKFHVKTGEFYRDKVEFPFFEQHLKGEKKADLPKAALVFETGSNVWRKHDVWPPAKTEKAVFAFGPGGTLSGEWDAAGGADDYLSDPAKPVPYIEKVMTGMDGTYMTADQRFAGRRPDVLVYQTPELKEDVTAAGPVEVELHVATTGTDADFVVKLIDVYPEDYADPDAGPGAGPGAAKMAGYQQLVRGEPFRGKYRNSLSQPEPFEPGKPAVIKFTMPDIAHCFRSGHRLMVQVQSSWFPLIDRNPQTFCDISMCGPEAFKKATQTVFHSAAKPSGVTLRVVK